MAASRTSGRIADAEGDREAGQIEAPGPRLPRRRVLVGAAAAGVAAAVRGLQMPERTRAAAAAGGRLVFAMWQSPESLDPGTSGLISSGYIATNMFDPLIWHLPGMRRRTSRAWRSGGKRPPTPNGSRFTSARTSTLRTSPAFYE